MNQRDSTSSMPVPEEAPTSQNPAEVLSKRGARRVIQRAFVLMCRDKALRQHIRELEIATLWTIEDWELEWTVNFHRGRFEVERRPPKHPDVTLSWATADVFFQQAEHPGDVLAPVQIDPLPQYRRLFETLLRGFFSCLRRVLNDPVDDVGESLV